MKHILISLTALILACSPKDRFCDKVGTAFQIDTLRNIEYSEGLTLDLYTPIDLELYNKPIIILEHGMGDTKKTEDLTFHCFKLASKGFLVASVGWSTPDPFTIDTTLYFQTGVQPIVDFHQAIEFFLNDARNRNQFGIDTTRMFIGGSSFGAISALHLGFADSLEEFPETFAHALKNKGNTDDQWRTHKEKINGVINFSGWMWNTSFIDGNDPGLISIYGENDELVPFDSDTASINGIKIMLANGPKPIHKRLTELEIENDLFVVPGGGHVSYYDPQWRDSVANRVLSFLENLTCIQNNKTPDKK